MVMETENISKSQDKTSTGGLVSSTENGTNMNPFIYKTILEDSTNYHVKHPLQFHWTLFQKVGQVEGASRNVSEVDWKNKLKESVTIGTVEDFWCLYNTMQDVTTIPLDCDYFFMREGIQPVWEDAAHKGGCDFRVTITRNSNAANMWKMALLMAIGCQLTDYQYLTGVQFAIRSGRNRIVCWFSAVPQEALSRIRQEFSQIMEKASGVEADKIRVDMTEFKTEDHRNERNRNERGGGDRDRDREGGRGGGWNRGGSGRGSVGGGDRRSSFARSGSDRDERRSSRNN